MKFRLLLTTLATTAICSLSATSSAQEVVGITKSSPTVVRQLFPKCTYKRCVPTGFETQVTNHAGGTAYDSRLRGVWVSNGLQLANVDPWQGNCSYICKPQRMPMPAVVGVKQFCTGLAYCDSGALDLPNNATGPGWLFASYSTGYIARMDSRRCSLRPKYCKFPVPTGWIISGIATDDVNRRLFVGITRTASAGSHVVYVTNLDKDFCKPICKFSLSGCSTTQRLRVLTGLAFDPCRQVLFATDGLLTERYVVSKPPSCQVKPAGCCRRTGDPFTGLCYLPMRNLKSVGKSCTTKACESCPTMRAEVTGDPVLGNPFFGLGLRNAPNKTSTAVLAAGIGSCSAVGVNIGFCQNLRVALPPVLIFYSLPTISASGCNRNVTLPWKVPTKQNLCGLKVSFQWLVVCKGAPLGHGVTNCAEFTFSGS